MLDYTDMGPETTIDIIDCLIDAWKPSLSVLFSYEDALVIIRNLITIERSEFAMRNIQILTSGDDLIGVTLSLNLSKVQAARQVNVFSILDNIEDKAGFMSKLSVYNKCFQPLSKEEGAYLSKFAVSKQFRGQGMGTVLMDKFIEHHNSDLPIFLEVHKSNAAAINLYKKYHFNIVETTNPGEYIFMKRMKLNH